MPADGLSPLGPPMQNGPRIFGVIAGRPTAAMDVQYGSHHPNPTHLFFWVEMGAGPDARYEAAAHVQGTAGDPVNVWRSEQPVAALPAEGFSTPAWDYSQLGLDPANAVVVHGDTMRREITDLLASGTVDAVEVAGMPFEPNPQFASGPLPGMGIHDTHFNHDRHPFNGVDGGLAFYVQAPGGNSWLVRRYFVRLGTLP